MAGNPWSKFFWQDWESDQALKLCSLAAQGLWMRMLCIAAAHDPIGYVAVAGKALDETDLARLTGTSESEVLSLLGELAAKGVFSRDRHQRIYSRRMIRDARKVDAARKNGKLGGNPKLGKHDENSGSDNPPLKAKVKGGDKPHKPEARLPLPNGNGRPEPPNLADRLWSDGLAVVVSFGIAEPKARGLLGKWRKTCGDAKALALLADAQQRGVSDLIPWMEQMARRAGDSPVRRETEHERQERERREWVEANYGPNSPRARQEREGSK
jgi:hypothetical protein